MEITNETHFNPCFWTAYWNLDYFNAMVAGKKVGRARRQQIYSLNLKSGQVHSTITGSVHVDKKIGIAEITPEALIEFYKKYFPEKVDTTTEYLSEHPEELVLDIECLWTKIEETPAYKILINIVTRNEIIVDKELEWLACFVILQRLRSHAVFQSMLELNDLTATPRFEHFWILKSILSNADFLNSLVQTIYKGTWTFYIVQRHTFFLSDSAVCLKPNGYFVAISPRILLEIDVRGNQPGILVRKKYDISSRKLNQYNRHCVRNSFKEIIFHDQELLERLLKKKYLRDQVKYISSNRSFTKTIARVGRNEIIRTRILG